MMTFLTRLFSRRQHKPAPRPLPRQQVTISLEHACLYLEGPRLTRKQRRELRDSIVALLLGRAGVVITPPGWTTTFCPPLGGHHDPTIREVPEPERWSVPEGRFSKAGVSTPDPAGAPDPSAANADPAAVPVPAPPAEPLTLPVTDAGGDGS